MMNWRNLHLSENATHHVIDGVPAYDMRFDAVLKFHAPGLAPVQLDSLSWHIDRYGQAVYPQRFQGTFGFYDGLAAVVSENGWHHIHADGTDLSAVRYAWCGNFQEGRCAVRQKDGDYLHILLDGRPAYMQRWRYVGDFKDHIAVVQGHDGQSTHIDSVGASIHQHGFIDLDVFHKGYARAKVEAGWMHIDLSGHAIYSRRFAAVEPFYNGQARVERFDGGLEVINTAAACLVELRPARQSEFAQLSADLVGFWKTKTIFSAVELQVFEALPAPAEHIACMCGLVPDCAPRLLHALHALDLVQCVDGIWRVTPKGALLQKNHPLTLADAAIEYGQYLSPMWDSLSDAMRGNGKWQTPDIFQQVAHHVSRLSPHHRMLQSYAIHDYKCIPDALDLDGVTRLIDAGGGTGTLTTLLLEHYPSLTVILFDLPQVVDHAQHVLGKQDRITFLGGDLFQPWPIQVDAVLLARVLHDWDDHKALHILQAARATLPLGGRIFIVEMLLSEDDMSGSLCDLHLMMTTGGRERHLHDYENLLNRAGFYLSHLVRVTSLSTILVGVARCA